MYSEYIGGRRRPDITVGMWTMEQPPAVDGDADAATLQGMSSSYVQI